MQQTMADLSSWLVMTVYPKYLPILCTEHWIPVMSQKM